ncbi:hypothetical protein RCOM_1080780 [Ricinus communis]|uniref:Leucine-rich repeat-containing N-terminal plant-type domain-containing protein n=1 Tax=Ricinus communis TaxID=3988 RepID=B9RMG6_RICCO|nr:hypothetical protein RCOM_1080780 [Ricinus communis]
MFDKTNICIGSERKVLLEFKGGLKDPSGQLSSWVGEDCCRWSGIGCIKKNRHVIKLEVSSLSGIVPPHLGNLSNLLYLSLNENDNI